MAGGADDREGESGGHQLTILAERIRAPAGRMRARLVHRQDAFEQGLVRRPAALDSEQGARSLRRWRCLAVVGLVDDWPEARAISVSWPSGDEPHPPPGIVVYQ